MSNLITARKNYIPPSYIRAAAADKHANPWNYADDISTVSLWMNSDASRGGLFNMTKAANPFSKANIGSTLSGVTSVLGPVASNLISDGYSAGSGFNTVMSTVLALNTGNPVVDTIKNVAATAILGLGNRAFGTKRNETNINALNVNKAQARTAGTTLGSASTTNDLLASAGQMTGGMGFKTTDLVKGGWFAKGKARKQGLGMLNQETAALAYLNHGLQTGANNVDTKQDSMVMRNFAALGGPLIGVDPSTAIGYQLYTDKYVRDNNRSVPNMFAGTPKIFALGGDIQTHGADWDTGVNHVNAGGTHEENPYDGVQMGVDQLNVPNLVEEGEVIYKDYVFSNRLGIPKYDRKDDSREAKALRKYSGKTFADTAKKIEKRMGADERTDAITKAGLDVELQLLAQVLEKERQKLQLLEMQDAIDNMTPEEFAMLQLQMQAQQDAEALQEAMAQQQQMIPQGMEQMAPPEEMMSAYGGPIYALGGLLEGWEPEGNMFGEGGDKSFRDWWMEHIVNHPKKLSSYTRLDMPKIYKHIFHLEDDEVPQGDDNDLYEAIKALYDADPEDFNARFGDYNPWLINSEQIDKYIKDTAFDSEFQRLLESMRLGETYGFPIQSTNLDDALLDYVRNESGIGSKKYSSLTPLEVDKLYEVYNTAKKAEFELKYPDIPYEERNNPQYRKMWDKTDPGYAKYQRLSLKEKAKQERKEEKARLKAEKAQQKAERAAAKLLDPEANKTPEDVKRNLEELKEAVSEAQAQDAALKVATGESSIEDPGVKEAIAKTSDKETRRAAKEEARRAKMEAALEEDKRDNDFNTWWNDNLGSADSDTDWLKVYKSITGEDDGPTSRKKVKRALRDAYDDNQDLLKDYDPTHYMYKDDPKYEETVQAAAQAAETPTKAEEALYSDIDEETLRQSEADARRALDLIMGVTGETSSTASDLTGSQPETATTASSEEKPKEDKNSLDYKLRKSLERLYKKNTKKFDYDELNGHAKAAFEEDLRKVKENPELLKEDTNRELNISGYKGNKSKMEFNQYATNKARDAYLGSPLTLNDNGKIAIQYNNEGTIPQALSFIQNGLTYDGKKWKDALGNIVDNPYSKEYGFTDVKRNWNNWGYIDKDGNWHNVDAPVPSTSGNTDYRFTPSAEWAKDLGDAKSYEQLEEYLNNYADFIEALNKGDKDALKRLYVLGEATKSNNPEDRKGKNRYFKEGVDPNNLKKEDVIGYDPNHPEYGIFGNDYYTYAFGNENSYPESKYALSKDGYLIEVGGKYWNDLSDEKKKEYTLIEGPLTREHLMNYLKRAINLYPENLPHDINDLYLLGVSDNVWGPHHLMANRGTTRYALVDELGNYIKDGDNIRYLDYNPDAAYNFYKKNGTDVTPIESLMIDGVNVDTIGVLGGTVDNHIGVRRNPDGTWQSYRLTPEQAAKLKQREIASTDERYGTLPQFEEAVGGYTLNPHYYELDDDAYKSLGFNDLGYTMNGLDKPDPFPRAPWWPYLAGAGLLLASLGYNIFAPKDYSNANAMIKAAQEAGNFTPVEFKPIGNYLTYRPMDIWAELNRMNAAARATDRAIMNSSSPYSSKVAGLLASGYNEQLGSGELFKKSLEYNDALNKQVAEFNKDTDKFNSEGLLKRDMANQDAATRARGFTLEGLKSGYAMRQAIDDAKSNAISAGISGLANLAYNYAANKYNQDLMGWGMRHNSWGPGIYYEEDAPKKTVSTPTYVSSGARGNTTAKGGKLKVRRKKGLGF